MGTSKALMTFKTIMTIIDKFGNFHNKKTTTATKTMTKTTQELVTFDTLITKLTIENLNLCDLPIKSDTGQHLQILRCFS